MTAKLLAAMAQYRLGKSDEAKAAFVTTVASIDKSIPKTPPAEGIKIMDWCILKVVRAEAEKTIN